MSEKKPVLELIVTHYDEPWETGRALFDMIEHQRCVDFSDIRIMLVQDGAEGALKWNEVLGDYSFPVQVLTIPHAGTAAARNAGMDHAIADWVMFCDFDDCFADVCSLRMMLDQIPIEEYDIIWGNSIAETRWRGGNAFLNKVDEANFASTDCKMYRRAFIEENEIRFDPDASLHYEYSFNMIAMACTQPFRVVMLTTDFYLYLKTNRVGGIRHTMSGMQELVGSRFRRDQSLARQFDERGLDYDYRKTIVRMICGEYYRINCYEDNPTPSDVSVDFLRFYRDRREILRGMSPIDVDVVRDIAETEMMGIIQDIYNQFEKEYYFVNDTVPFGEWLKKLDSVVDDPAFDRPERTEPDGKVWNRVDGADDGSVAYMGNDPVVIRNEPILLRWNEYSLTETGDNVAVAGEVMENAVGDEPEREPRVAVYCGTYNTYISMMVSAKSLIANTRMDKVYFLIEDDAFPYELPDIVECINVKGQKWFPEDGPNYNNCWSYMCMMRAVFTKIIPYDRVLSLDIDVVVQEDIGCLWDIDLTDYYLAGVEEPQRKKVTSDPMYINFGVVMMNLKKLRKDGIDDAVIADLNKTRFGCPEQDAFNKHCAYHIYRLSNDYNATVHSHITGEAERERIVHFAGIKFWRHYGQVKQYSVMGWDAVMEMQKKLREKD